MLFRRVHFAKGFLETIWLEDRVIAKAMSPAFWPDDFAFNPAFEILDMPVRPGQRQGTNKRRTTIRMVANAVLDLFHRHVEILVRPGPARGINPRRAIKGGNGQTTVIGKGRKIGAIGRSG